MLPISMYLSIWIIIQLCVSSRLVIEGVWEVGKFVVEPELVKAMEMMNAPNEQLEVIGVATKIASKTILKYQISEKLYEIGEMGYENW